MTAMMGALRAPKALRTHRRRRSAQALQGPRGDHPHDVIPGPSAGDFLAHWSRMTLRVIQQTHYYEDQTRKFLQWQWKRMTLKVIRTWETEIACTASNIRHNIKWTRILARRRLPTPEGTIVRNRDPDVKCGAFGSGLCTHVAASSRVALLRPRSSSSSPTLLGVALGRGPADQLD